ncbi:MAG: hypothetical protein LBC97_09675 [Bifidobacteriaceae bacterium]|jgi:hypothetical protein|nr:hypothetical protein [Bifidobacteriaceae bacterium]
MGSGSWSHATYAAATGVRVASGTAFGYDRHARATGVAKAHEALDPTKLNAAGKNVREAFDNPDHPTSLPIVVGFDSTGSMGSVPRVVQHKLATLFALLIDKGYATDPQIAIATYGDATCDYVPLQISQFESDNRIDENLDRLYLEGGGGGNDGETSQLLLYYLAHHTETDAWRKRGKKGYVFLIADEKQIPIAPGHVREFIGDGQPLGDLSFEGIAADVAKTWEIRILLINNAAAFTQGSQAFYGALFGRDNVVLVQDPDAIAETIAAIIGFEEGRDAAAITADLTAAAGKEVALRVGQALRRPVGAGLR